MKWLCNRLKERSTWAGIFVLLGLVGVKLAPEVQELIIEILTAAAALVAILTKDGPDKAAEAPHGQQTGEAGGEGTRPIVSPEPTAEQTATLLNP